jgi:hypothetical protein
VYSRNSHSSLCPALVRWLRGIRLPLMHGCDLNHPAILLAAVGAPNSLEEAFGNEADGAASKAINVGHFCA